MIIKLFKLLSLAERYISYSWWRVSLPTRLRALGVDVEHQVQLLGMPIISLVPGSTIRICAGAVLCSRSDFTALGVSRPTILRTLQPDAQLVVGRNAGLSGTTICAARSVVIGSNCLIGADVLITDTDFHPVLPSNRRRNNSKHDVGTSPVFIGNNVFIGARCLILKGVTIGDNSVIGAGSVVTSDIPDNVIAAGSPARILRQLSIEDR